MSVLCPSSRFQCVKVIVQVEAVGIMVVFIGRDRSGAVREIVAMPRRRRRLF